MQKADVSKIYEKTVSPENESSNKYRIASKKKPRIIFFICVIVAIIFFIMSTYDLGYPIDIIIDRLVRFDDSDNCGIFIWRLQMPVAAATVLVGASLSLSGTVMQCVLRNPLSSPYTLGISAAASFGAAFAIIRLDPTASNPYTITTSAFTFAILSTVLITMLAKMTNISSEATVLAGIVISTLFSASLMLMQFLADSKQLSAIMSWTFGNLSSSEWTWNFTFLIIVLTISIYFYANRWNLNAMNASDEIAKGLGVNAEKFRLISLIMTALIPAVIASKFGSIAFIGLMGPHIARMIIGNDHKYLIPASMAVGACILLISNFIALNIARPAILPVGLFTSFMGAPMFIYLLLKRYKK